MAFTINRRLSTLVDSNGQLNTGKIPNDYIDGNHIADNVITTAMLHTSFTVSSSNLSSINSDAVSEGSTNLYHTSERVDDRVASLLTAGTGITLTYDDAANTLTIAGVAQYGDSDVESYLSGGTGVTFSSGVISIGQAVGTSDNVQFNNVQVDGTLTSDDITSTNISIAGNATITGNLTVSGTTTTVNSNTVNIGDNILVLNSDETGTPSQDGGIEIERGTSTNKTLVWDETNDKWTVGSETFVAATFEGALTGNVTGTVSDISNHNTDSLSEGSTNLYYTDARVESYLDGGTSTPTFASGIISGDLTVDTSTLKVDSTNNRVGIGNATPDVSLDIGSLTDAMHVPVGTTAQRPGTPAAGYFRYNSTTSQFEGYTTEWGAIAGSGGSAMETDTFTGDGSTTAFTLSTAASSEDNLIVFIEGVYQNKDVYAVSGTTLTFDVAPVNTRKIVVHHVKANISGNNMILNQFSGDGLTTAFTLTVSLTSENNSQIYIDGVYQQKNSYTVGGTTLTFDTAPANGTTIEVMIFTQTTINVPTANSIGISELNVSDGTNGQVLTTNGSGTLSFTSKYTDSDVETYLNTSTIYTDATNNRLGIGTSSPAVQLAVSNNGAEGIELIPSGGGEPIIQSYNRSGSAFTSLRLTASDLKFHTGSSPEQRMHIAASGNVGIGTTVADVKLHLGDTSASTLLKLERESVGGTMGIDFNAGNNGSIYNNIQYGRIDVQSTATGGGAESGVMTFHTRNSGTTAERMRIAASGNVTINSSGTIPTGVLLGRQLVVGSSTGSEVIAFREDTSVAVGDKVGAFLIGNSDTDGVEDHFVGMWGKVSSTNGSQNLHFAAGRSGYEGDTPQMTLDSSGNVGIGGTPTNYSDHKTLSLYGNTGTGAGFIEFNDTSGNADAVIFSDNGNLFINADYDNTVADSSIIFRVDGSGEKMRIKSDGQITTQGDILPGADVIMANGRGISFAATSNSSGSMSSELLDDYEEGTWTPAISGATHTVQQGSYTKVGDLVFFKLRIAWSAYNNAAGGVLTGLPFTSDAAIESMGVNVYVNSGFGSIPSGKGYLNAYVGANNTTLNFNWQPNTAVAEFAGSGNIYVSGTYLT